MDLEKYIFDVCERIKMFKYISEKEEFLARELFDRVKIPRTSGYRILEILCENKLLEKPENGNGSQYNVRYKITSKWASFYDDLRKRILDILL